MIEYDFQIPFVARLALAEKQIQQNYRPLIAVHKWFARRPGSLFRSLLLSEFADQRVEEAYFAAHDFGDKHVLDPFMGGGTTVVEANRLGCRVTAADINPMAWWIVRQQIQDLDLSAYLDAATALRAHLHSKVGSLFQTTCPRTGTLADVKYFLWVKTAQCKGCGKVHDLFPSYLIAQDVRHTANVFVCPRCGTLFESPNRRDPGSCPSCGTTASPTHLASRNRSVCLHCGASIHYPGREPPDHRLFAIEYHLPNPREARATKGRLFKAPDADDLSRWAEAVQQLRRLNCRFIPEEKIPRGDETERLRRWGFARYSELFNARQLLGLELSCRWIARHSNERVREALATNLSDLLRYQNMLCRYDISALKSLDVFSVHGFPVALIQCESNFLGIQGSRGLPIGSGGWLNIIEKFAKAKRYCVQPFEVQRHGHKKTEVPIVGEWIGTERRTKGSAKSRYVRLVCRDATEWSEDAIFDGIFTDPPYFGNVQYAELMDFCYVWLRRLVGARHPEFAGETTRHARELTGNISMGRDLVHFTEGIAEAFAATAKRLRKGGPLAFTYHHNRLDAYVPMAVAILDAGLVCSASLPCPAEMGASIHINGTESSVIDTVFVSRKTGLVPRRWVLQTAQELAELVGAEVEALATVPLVATRGDIRCIVHGHLTRLAIWELRHNWSRDRTTSDKMTRVAAWFHDFGGSEAVLAALRTRFSTAATRQQWTPVSAWREEGSSSDDISF